MKQFAFLIVGLLILASCQPAPTSHDMHGETREGTMKDLTIRTEEGDASQLAFSIRDEQKIFADYGVNHTKEMHLIIVRDDLEYFFHLHPERDMHGVWRVDFAPENGGSYWIYADFVDATGMPYLVRAIRKYPGDAGVTGTTYREATRTVGDFTVTLAKKRQGASVTLDYAITDSHGQPAHLEQYLGASAHTVLISSKGEYVHAHPGEVSPGKLSASATLESSGFYRAFTQFQINGKIMTAIFDLPEAE